VDSLKYFGRKESDWKQKMKPFISFVLLLGVTPCTKVNVGWRNEAVF
jgi:hypothetical protein